MDQPNPVVKLAIPLIASLLLAVPCFARNSDFNLNVHANSHATAKDIGLPVYPGATPLKDKDSDSSVDLGFVLNSIHFELRTVSFVTTASLEQVLEFYRKPLARYGEVLECNHGKPVGSLLETKKRLTCGDLNSGRMTANGSDMDHELRVGTPEKVRIVGIDSATAGETKFVLAEVVLPKNAGGK